MRVGAEAEIERFREIVVLADVFLVDNSNMPVPAMAQRAAAGTGC
jgi:hypothetical protein